MTMRSEARVTLIGSGTTASCECSTLLRTRRVVLDGPRAEHENEELVREEQE